MPVKKVIAQLWSHPSGILGVRIWRQSYHSALFHEALSRLKLAPMRLQAKNFYTTISNGSKNYPSH